MLMYYRSRSYCEKMNSTKNSLRDLLRHMTPTSWLQITLLKIHGPKVSAQCLQVTIKRLEYFKETLLLQFRLYLVIWWPRGPGTLVGIWGAEAKLQKPPLDISYWGWYLFMLWKCTQRQLRLVGWYRKRKQWNKTMA